MSKGYKKYYHNNGRYNNGDNYHRNRGGRRYYHDSNSGGQQQSFLERNKDGIIMSVVTGAIGYLMPVVGDIIQDKINPPCQEEDYEENPKFKKVVYKDRSGKVVDVRWEPIE